MYMEVPVLVCSPSVGNALRLMSSCDLPSGEPTRMRTSPTALHTQVLLPKIQERNVKKCQRNFPICNKVWLTGQWDLTALV
jgi:hypothetical protein